MIKPDIFIPRPSQAAVLEYRGGTMGISAVPGSGKTHVLSALAAQIIASGNLGLDQEVLIVTLVNSAVDNFSTRIGGFIQSRGLLQHVGYRVRTLHGLAHDIVREHPTLVGLDSRFSIIDEHEADGIRKVAVNAWLKAHPDDVNYFLDSTLNEVERSKVKRDNLPELINKLAIAFIRTAKDRRQTPESIRRHLDVSPPQPLAEIGWDIYANYQRALNYRGAVDFDDLIRLALEALTLSPELLHRLQVRFPYILEDEAQDSSELQEKILSKLFTGNWVRVGDPNQAIFESFTTAKPEYLINFIEHANASLDLPVSGRSQQKIIFLANTLIDWVKNEHPNQSCRDALKPPLIQATGKDDPQPNPPLNPASVYLIGKKYSPDEELNAIIRSLENWLPDNRDKTVAVLVPSNKRGIDLVEKLKQKQIDFIEYISSTSETRVAAGILDDITSYLANPSSASKLAAAYQTWRNDLNENEKAKNFHSEAAEIIRKCFQVETYISPRAGVDYLDTLAVSTELIYELREFRSIILRWLGATLLPVDQMILTLSQDLFSKPTDLALAHKLANLLYQVSIDHSGWRLPELSRELNIIARNERRFLGFSSDDTGFDSDRYKGKVVVTTMHKAKGLEWDRVYLTSVNNYDFPSGEMVDKFISEKWYVRDGLNLEAEALTQLENILESKEFGWREEGKATINARTDFVRERLRLLYVGITRAKKDLILTWNTGRRGDQVQAIPFAALQGLWEKHFDEEFPN